MTTHPDLPEAAREHAPAPNQRKFVLAALASYAAALLGIIAFNVTVDPFAIAGTGLFSTAVESDRGAKLTLMEELTTGPEILILGSSRARLAQPDQLKRLTGHSAFNAAVGGGTAADAWVMTRFLSDRFPNQQRGYLWFVDLGVATNGVNPQLAGDRRAQRYLSGRQGRFGLEDVGTYLSSSASSASYRVNRASLRGACRAPIRYHADGSITPRAQRFLPERAQSLARAVEEKVARVRANLPSGRVAPYARRMYFERTLAFMNAHGARPVIVINPIHPAVLAVLKKDGFAARRAAALEYLNRLQRRLDFVVVECEDIGTWGGSTDDFLNATHINSRNMKRMLEYVVAHSDGALA